MIAPKRIAMVAGEPSGDLVAAPLVKSLKKHFPTAIIEGVGGDLMEGEGLSLLFSMEKLAVMGFTEIITKLPQLLYFRHRLYRYFKKHKPDIFIGVDFPTFNFGLEKKLKKIGVKTVHFVSPKLWASRKGRIHKIKHYVDLMLTLFPFETAFYHKHGMRAKFVGHPAANQIAMVNDKKPARETLGLPPNKKIIALLPGSRSAEIAYLAPVFIDAAAWCFKQDPHLQFIMPLARESFRKKVRTLIQQRASTIPIKLISHHARDVIAASDVVLLAHGTATLETTLIKRPMVAAYKFSRLSYWIAKSIVTIENFALPNLLAGERVIPEFIQDEATAEACGKAVMQLLQDEEKQSHLHAIFTRIHEKLKKPTEELAVEAIVDLLGGAI